MERKVFMSPTPTQAARDTSNSINQIVLHLAEHLPTHGWLIVEDMEDANITASHAGQNPERMFPDVAHCHGLYPTAIYDEPDKQWHYAANRNVLDNLQHAQAVTVPSTWVADILRRDMNLKPVVVPWGIVRKNWRRQWDHNGYTLWNKTRMSAVCDPAPLRHLAKAIPDTTFVSTFYPDKIVPENVTVTGHLPFDEMKPIIEKAALYLATTKETFGIGTLEAMACGIPILGYRWGATPDIVEHGVTGYLVEPGDLDGLVEGWKWCMKYRGTRYNQVLGNNAFETARHDRYTFDRVAEQFAEVYDSVHNSEQIDTPYELTVVIPTYNYAHFLPTAVVSAMEQETDFPYHVVIVNDASADNTPAVLEELRARYPDEGALSIINLPENGGVAQARNTGIAATNSPLVICLDADDAIADDTVLQTMRDALVSDVEIGVVYTDLYVTHNIKPGGEGLMVSGWPPPFVAEQQAKKKNHVPTFAMMKRAAWLRAGGYKTHLQPAEDAALWTSVMHTGYHIRKLKETHGFIYRMHNGSLSHAVRMNHHYEPDWIMAWHDALTNNIPMNSTMPTVKEHSHPVRNYDNPLVSVIIPVGAGHEQIVMQALDSVWGQTEWRWECIVVNDTGEHFELPYSWPRMVHCAKSGGAGAARNVGLQLAKGRYVLFLDADDYLLPEFIEKALLHHRSSGRYIYTDWYEARVDSLLPHKAEEYSTEAIFRRMSIHAITTLIPKDWIAGVGGFDESLPAWEDTDLFMKLAADGKCGQRLPEPLFVYNYHMGQRREVGAEMSADLKVWFNQKFGVYIRGETMCKCDEVMAAKFTAQTIVTDGMVRVMMSSGGTAKTSIIGGMSKTRYGRRQRGEIFYMLPEDVQAMPDLFSLVSTTDFSPQSTTVPGEPPSLGGAM